MGLVSQAKTSPIKLLERFPRSLLEDERAQVLDLDIVELERLKHFRLEEILPKDYAVREIDQFLTNY